MTVRYRTAEYTLRYIYKYRKVLRYGCSRGRSTVQTGTRILIPAYSHRYGLCQPYALGCVVVSLVSRPLDLREQTSDEVCPLRAVRVGPMIDQPQPPYVMDLPYIIDDLY